MANQNKWKYLTFAAGIVTLIFIGLILYNSVETREDKERRYGHKESYTQSYPTYSSTKDNSSEKEIHGSNRDYIRTSPGYDANAPLLPRSKDDIEPLYNEIQRRKEQQGISGEEAVRQILREAGEIK